MNERRNMTTPKDNLVELILHKWDCSKKCVQIFKKYNLVKWMDWKNLSEEELEKYSEF